MAREVAQMNSQGRVVIPVAIRREMGIEGPVELFFELDDGVLTVRTFEEVLKDVQAVVASYIPSDPKRSIVDEFLAERRAEAERDEREYQERYG